MSGELNKSTPHDAETYRELVTEIVNSRTFRQRIRKWATSYASYSLSGAKSAWKTYGTNRIVHNQVNADTPNRK
jgi:hypothetical protein